MSDVTWFGVVVIAAGAQFAVLPGEKVQFIIAGLSTEYNPFLVVSAAGTAFAGWTVLEIWLGQTLVQVLPGTYLDAITAALFIVFAILLVRSAPPAETGDQVAEPAYQDGGELDVSIPLLGWTVPSKFGGFLPIFALMAFGEFGDKTQLITIALASQYAAFPTAIWTGEMLAIIPVSLLNALFFHTFSNQFDLRKAHFAGAAIFAFFATDFLVRVLFNVSPWGALVDWADALLPM